MFYFQSHDFAALPSMLTIIHYYHCPWIFILTCLVTFKLQFDVEFLRWKVEMMKFPLLESEFTLAMEFEWIKRTTVQLFAGGGELGDISGGMWAGREDSKMARHEFYDDNVMR